MSEPSCPYCGFEKWHCARCGAACPPFTPEVGKQPLLIPPLFRGSTIFILADGPSLCQEDVDLLRERGHVLAINYSLQLAPFADIFYYYHDEKLEEMVGPGGLEHLEALRGEGLLVYHTNPGAAPRRPWPYLPFSGVQGLELDPEKGLRNGGNSGHAAINLAIRLGAARIILLGFDCGERPGGVYHWWKAPGSSSRPTYDYQMWRENFKTLVRDLPPGVELLNASRETTIDCIPRVRLEEVLA